MFADPAVPGGGESIKWATLLNTLVIVDVKSYEANIQTSMGVSEAVRADVYCIDGPAAPDTYSDTLIFPKVLRSQLSSKIGQQVLGRIGQGPAQPGKNPAWILNPATEADKQLAVQAWNQIQAGQFVNPAAPQQAAPQQVAHNPWAVNAQPPTQPAQPVQQQVTPPWGGVPTA